MLGLLLLRRSARVRAEGLLQAWQAEDGRAIGAEAAAASRLEVKAGMPVLRDLAWMAADGRWLGDPVHLVVFDGDAEVKAGALDDLRVITFVTVGEDGCPEEDAVAECVKAGRVRWETLRLP